MPPKPIGDRPMTATERTRKRRERLRRERGADPSPAAIIDALRKENAALRRQLAAKPAAPVPQAKRKSRRK
jgi:hypothetical protein